jgi:hypothetical protein
LHSLDLSYICGSISNETCIFYLTKYIIPIHGSKWAYVACHYQSSNPKIEFLFANYFLCAYLRSCYILHVLIDPLYFTINLRVFPTSRVKLSTQGLEESSYISLSTWYPDSLSITNYKRHRNSKPWKYANHHNISISLALCVILQEMNDPTYISLSTPIISSHTICKHFSKK